MSMFKSILKKATNKLGQLPTYIKKQVVRTISPYMDKQNEFIMNSTKQKRTRVHEQIRQRRTDKKN